MASKRLLDKRREHEAAEKQGKVKKETKSTKKSARKTTTTRKRKVKAPERKRLMWGVFSGTLKEEGRFLWNERDKAEERLAQLRAKSKKLYFIQTIKESLSDAARATAKNSGPEEDEDVAVDELQDEATSDDEDDADAEDEDDSEEE